MSDELFLELLAMNSRSSLEPWTKRFQSFFTFSSNTNLHNVHLKFPKVVNGYLAGLAHDKEDENKRYFFGFTVGHGTVGPHWEAIKAGKELTVVNGTKWEDAFDLRLHYELKLL